MKRRDFLKTSGVIAGVGLTGLNVARGAQAFGRRGMAVYGFIEKGRHKDCLLNDKIGECSRANGSRGWAKPVSEVPGRRQVRRTSTRPRR